LLGKRKSGRKSKGLVWSFIAAPRAQKLAVEWSRSHIGTQKRRNGRCKKIEVKINSEKLLYHGVQAGEQS
jgi:hypothetical protein